MDLNRLAIFVRVVEASSFTSAARTLGLRKSSVSRAVSRLEDDLGIKLLHRTTRSLSLTDAGRSYFERVRGALSGVDEATSVIKEMGNEPRGVVRMTATPDVAARIFGDLIVRFVRLYPKIRVELVLTSRSMDLVEEKIDIALRAGRLQASSLVARKILSTDLELFASPGYLHRRGTPKKLRDLASHDCLLYRPEAGKNTWRLTGPKGDESVEVTGSIGADDMSFLRSAAMAGGGIALLPSLNLAKSLEQGELVRVLPAYRFGGGWLYLVSPAGRQNITRVRLLRDFLLANLPKAPWDSI